MTAPRRSREVHAERFDVTAPSVDADALRLLETDPSAYFAATHKRLPVGFAEGGYTMGAAACVCEEPCRYCKCAR